MDRGLLVWGILLCFVDTTLACSAGAVVGAIIGTAAVCCIIFGIIIFLLLKKGILKKGDKNKAVNKPSADASYVNPAFHAEEREGTSRPNAILQAEQGRGGYVPCAEYESPNKDKKLFTVQPNGGVQKSSWTPNFKEPVTKNTVKSSSHSSHGSLDDTYVTNDPEVVSVSLQSQDFIGLGFNIWGSMRDGVFVSQVHNRGPAIETGKIKPGDRILDITISFENMVYEDALTILSYASPYPVRLLLQKATPDKEKETEGEETDTEDAVHHPVYRSQSMDDVSKIQKERFSFRMRRARSEMKRGSSKKNQDADTGTLRKWKAKQDMVGLQASAPSPQVENNFAYTNMDINTNSLMADLNEEVVKTEATVHQQQAPRVIGIDIPDSRGQNQEDDDERLKIERLRAQIQSEWNAAPAEMVGKSTFAAPVAKSRNVEEDIDFNSGKLVFRDVPAVETKAPIYSDTRKDSVSSKSEDSSEFDDVGGEIDNAFLMRALKLSEPDSQIVPDVGEEVVIGEQDESKNMIKLSPARRRDQSESSSSSEDEMRDDGKNNQQVEVASTDEYVVVNLAEKKKLSALDETNASMVVNFSENSLLMKDDPDVPLESSEDTSFHERKNSQNSDEDEIRMLKDYLGDRPFLVDNLATQLDSSEEEKDVAVSGMTVHKTVTVNKVSSEGETTTTETVLSADGNQVIETTSSALEFQDVDTDISELSKLKTKALFDAKHEIRRRSDSENEDKTTTSESSISSRSASPQPDDDLDMDLFAIRQKLTMREINMEMHDSSDQDDESAAGKSDSPDIQRRSGGGLSYDITASEFDNMPDEIEQQPRGDPKGGVAYYVGIGDELRAPKLDGLDDGPIPTPALVRSWDTPQESNKRDSTSSSDSSHDAQYYPAEGGTDPGQITFKLPPSSFVEGNNNELPNSETKHGVSLDMNYNGRSSSSESTPTKNVSEFINKTEMTSSERFTLTTHDESKGAYTMTVNSFDDSEA